MCDTCGCDDVLSPTETVNRIINVEQNILSKNNDYAKVNRDHFIKRKILTINLLSSPGSGKTTLLQNSISSLKSDINMSVIIGDQQTDNDMQRIAKLDVPALQINTGKGCHLDATQIARAVKELKVQDGSLLFIENIGNLVCPSLFDLGEAFKVVMLSVTEGSDKPLKYPDMFHAADIMILNKMDLLPYVDFDVEKCIEYAVRINPNVKIFQLSASKCRGLEPWLQWLREMSVKSFN